MRFYALLLFRFKTIKMYIDSLAVFNARCLTSERTVDMQPQIRNFDFEGIKLISV